MRCLYCGKPLPLLKKLTGGGEFCSDAHRHKYQEEYNKLALSRLLQAQTSPGETGSFGIPGGHTGLRQLAAPAPPPLANAPRALPAPSGYTTAHHQVSHIPPPQHQQHAPLLSVPPPAPRVIESQPRPSPLPKVEPVKASPPPPDPKEAAFLIRMHAPVPPASLASLVKPDAGFASIQGPPTYWEEPPVLVPDAFDWDGAAQAIAASREPDPPEARAWRHPQEVVAPAAPPAAAGTMRAFESFAAKPLYPMMRTGLFAPSYPARVSERLPMTPSQRSFVAVSAKLRLSSPKDWELKLSTPAWKPAFFTVAAPVVPASPVAVTGFHKASAQPAVAAANVEVFIDLSALGMLDQAPARRR